MENRGIKTQRINKTKLPLQIYNNGLTIIIGQLWLVQLTIRQTEREDVNKRDSRPFVDKISIMVCLLDRLPPFFPSSYWSYSLIYDCEDVHSKLGDLVLVVLYVFIPLFNVMERSRSISMFSYIHNQFILCWNKLNYFSFLSNIS